MITKRAMQPGFSLVELMVYLAIVGALSAGLFGIWKFVGRAKLKSTEAILRTIDSNIKSYREDTGNFPNSLQDLFEAPAGVKSWHGPYIDSGEPLDGWGAPIQYELKGKNAFELYSWGNQGEGSPENTWVRAKA